MTTLVWYAAYGSNMTWRRFRCYIEGGLLAETGRDHCGARDPSPPADTRAVWLPGRVYFATQTAFWGGGRALFDPDAPGIAAGRAWLVTAAQLCDVMAQEMKRGTGADLDLPVTPGREHRLRAGDGHYETVTCAGRLAGYPVITFCAPWAMGAVPPLAPSPAYLAMLAAGLGETFGWHPRRAGAYLAGLPGARA